LKAFKPTLVDEALYLFVDIDEAPGERRQVRLHHHLVRQVGLEANTFEEMREEFTVRIVWKACLPLADQVKVKV
jgi:hypothetical protein